MQPEIVWVLFISSRLWEAQLLYISDVWNSLVSSGDGNADHYECSDTNNESKDDDPACKKEKRGLETHPFIQKHGDFLHKPGVFPPLLDGNEVSFFWGSGGIEKNKKYTINDKRNKGAIAVMFAGLFFS